MLIDEPVKRAIDAINAGMFNKYLEFLSGTDLGLYIPAYVDAGTVKLLEDEYSQCETNLSISLVKNSTVPEGTKTVAWIGGTPHRDRFCRHGDTKSCRHCTVGHDRGTVRCTRHPRYQGLLPSQELGNAPQLDYASAVEALKNKEDILDSLALENVGLALIHGHSDRYEFTKLPVGCVSVISNGVTSFRTLEVVGRDSTFVPNMWRVVNGEFQVAGGYSEVHVLVA